MLARARLTPGKPPPTLYPLTRHPSNPRLHANSPTSRKVEKPESWQVGKSASWQVGTHHQRAGERHPPHLAQLHHPPRSAATPPTPPTCCARRFPSSPPPLYPTSPTRRSSSLPCTRARLRPALIALCNHCKLLSPRNRARTSTLYPPRPACIPPASARPATTPPLTPANFPTSRQANKPANTPPPSQSRAGESRAIEHPSVPPVDLARLNVPPAFLLAYPPVNHRLPI